MFNVRQTHALRLHVAIGVASRRHDFSTTFQFQRLRWGSMVQGKGALHEPPPRLKTNLEKKGREIPQVC